MNNNRIPASLSSLPNECLLEIFKWMDEYNLGETRLLNHRFGRLATPFKFESLFTRKSGSLDKFPKHLFHLVKSMTFCGNESTYEVAWALLDQSQTVKKVLLYVPMNNIILRALTECHRLEEMRMWIEGNLEDFRVQLANSIENKQQMPWKYLRKLTIATLGSSNGRLDGFFEFFPSLTELDAPYVNCVDILLPPTITTLSIDLSESNDVHLLANLENQLPFLKTLLIYGYIRQLRLPEHANRTITDLSIWLQIDEFFSLGDCFKSFPCLRRLDVSLDQFQDKINLGSIISGTTDYLKELEVDCSLGPAIWEVVNALPNLTKLKLMYSSREKFRAETAPPLADFRKMKNMHVSSLSCGNSYALAWLRHSILNTVRSEGSIYLAFSYESRGPIRGERLVSLLITLSNVVKSINLEFDKHFQPEWLDGISSRLKTLDLVSGYVERAVVGDDDLRQRWKVVLERLHARGIKLQGTLVDVYYPAFREVYNITS